MDQNVPPDALDAQTLPEPVVIGEATLRLGDCLNVLRTMPENSVDAVVTDPPYGLSKEPDIAEVLRHWLAGDHYEHGQRGFMGRDWDSFVPNPNIWREVIRVLKPGGHVLCFAGTRTQDLMGMSLRLAGFEIRDCIRYEQGQTQSVGWVFGTGFPKSLDVSKAIDKAAYSAPMFDDIRAHLRKWRDTRGYTNPSLDKAMGNWMACHWMSEGTSQPAIPTKEQWVKLKAVLAWDDCEFDAIYDRIKDGAERPVVGVKPSSLGGTVAAKDRDPAIIAAHRDKLFDVTAPATDAAKQWKGWGTALKPAWETVLVGVKPLLPEHEAEAACTAIIQLWSRLWLMLPAQFAEQCFTSSPAAYGVEASAFAAWTVEDAIQASSALSEPMGTLPYASAVSGALSTVSSWSATLAEHCSRQSTCTTGMACETTTDWRTLRSWISQITPACIIQASSPANAWNADASLAVRSFSDAVSKLSGTREPSVAAPATSQVPSSFPAEVARPSHVPIFLARKPLEGTVAENVLKHGTGGINVDACRVAGTPRTTHADGNRQGSHPAPMDWGSSTGHSVQGAAARYPANLAHDGSEDVHDAFAAFGEKNCQAASGSPVAHHSFGVRTAMPGCLGLGPNSSERYADTGTAARFFPECPPDASDVPPAADQPVATADYDHKPREGISRAGSEKWRMTGDMPPPHPAGRFPPNLVTDGSPDVEAAFAEFGETTTTARGPKCGIKGGNKTGNGVYSDLPQRGYAAGTTHADTGTAARFYPACPGTPDEKHDRFYYSSKANKAERAGSIHPTVKPQALMRWLCKLVTPPGGVVLDCFAGSGSTGQAAVACGFRPILIEREAEYFGDIVRRMERQRDAPPEVTAKPRAVTPKPDLPGAAMPRTKPARTVKAAPAAPIDERADTQLGLFGDTSGEE